MKFTPNSLVEQAPTLADLKKLPIEVKSRALLARLEKIGRLDSSALYKQNLMLPNDPYQLAAGYAVGEKRAVIDHLLGGPWTKLVNEALLVDSHGQGFHKVSEEGLERLGQDFRPTRDATLASSQTSPDKPPPRVLLSYRWEGEEEDQWVRSFATRLQGESGVEVVFDQWHLPPGADRTYFMEEGVRDSDFVIIVCTPGYAERANSRQGGVGYESMVITGELAEDPLVRKFIPVLRSGNWTDSLPSYLKPRRGVDLSGNPYSKKEYETLLRALHGVPIQPPPLGPRPDFSNLAPQALDPAIRSEANQEGSSGSILGPAKGRPGAIYKGVFSKAGANVPWEHAEIRHWPQNATDKQYSFESSRGEEYLGDKAGAAKRFFEFKQQLYGEGYGQRTIGGSSDPEFRMLNW